MIGCPKAGKSSEANIGKAEESSILHHLAGFLLRGFTVNLHITCALCRVFSLYDNGVLIFMIKLN